MLAQLLEQAVQALGADSQLPPQISPKQILAPLDFPVHIVLQLEPHELEFYNNKKIRGA